MATITHSSKNSASITRSTKPSNPTIYAGTTIGMFPLIYTYASTVFGYASITHSSKNSASITHQTKS